MAHRSNDGLDVTLYWHPGTDEPRVCVCDQPHGAYFEMRPERHLALDAYYQPYSQVGLKRAVGGRPARRLAMTAALLMDGWRHAGTLARRAERELTRDPLRQLVAMAAAAGESGPGVTLSLLRRGDDSHGVDWPQKHPAPTGPSAFSRRHSVNPTIQLGRIAGVRIGLNWSWLVVFALIVWSLAAAVFPSQNPGFSDGEYIALAVAAALLFFASLYPVMDSGRPIGLLTFASVARVPRDQWDMRRVRDVMIGRDDVPLLADDDPAIDALAELSESKANRGLVMEDGRLIGLLSITDLLRALEVRPRSGPLDKRRRPASGPATP